jgi:predicted Fe-Mo cluster-binding NifX family protein
MLVLSNLLAMATAKCRIYSYRYTYFNQASKYHLVDVEAGRVSQVEDEGQPEAIGTLVEIILICVNVDMILSHALELASYFAVH